jgi:hypothetical protein
LDAEAFGELRENWQNVFIAAAARSHHLAGEEDRGGFFTQALCDALSGEGGAAIADAEGRVSVQAAFDWAAREAQDRAERCGHKQTCVGAGIARRLILTRLPVSPPRPPAIVHALRPARDYQHREELDTLRRWWSGSGRGGVMSLIGIGGAGKTALAHRFLSELPGSTVNTDGVLKLDTLPAPHRLFVWSFYETPNTGESLYRLCDYLTNSQPARGGPDDLGRIQIALERGAAEPTLIVLDGLEKIQRESDQRGRLRDDAAPLRRLLQWIAASRNNAWTLVTTRFPIIDLEPWNESGYLSVLVEKLSLDAARKLLRARGVVGTESQLDALIGQFGRHALTLTLLGGLLKRYCGGDPDGVHELPQLIDIVDGGGGDRELDEQAFRLGRILAAYERDLSEDEVQIMKIISSFRVPVDVDTIAGAFDSSRLRTRRSALDPRRRRRLPSRCDRASRASPKSKCSRRTTFLHPPGSQPILSSRSIFIAPCGRTRC